MVIAQNKVLADLLIKKICGGISTQSEYQSANKWQHTDKTWRRDNRTSTEEKSVILSGIARLA